MKKPLKNLLYATLFVSLSLSSALADVQGNEECNRADGADRAFFTVAKLDSEFCKDFYFCTLEGDGTYTGLPNKCPDSQAYDKKENRCKLEHLVTCG